MSHTTQYLKNCIPFIQALKLNPNDPPNTLHNKLENLQKIEKQLRKKITKIVEMKNTGHYRIILHFIRKLQFFTEDLLNNENIIKENIDTFNKDLDELIKDIRIVVDTISTYTGKKANNETDVEVFTRSKVLDSVFLFLDVVRPEMSNLKREKFIKKVLAKVKLTTPTGHKVQFVVEDIFSRRFIKQPLQTVKDAWNSKSFAQAYGGGGKLYFPTFNANLGLPIIFHELCHSLKYSNNHLLTANAFTAYFSSNYLEKTVEQPSFLQNEKEFKLIEKSLKKNISNSIHVFLNSEYKKVIKGYSYAQLGRILGQQAILIDIYSKVPGRGMFFLKEICEGQPIKKTTKLVNSGVFDSKIQEIARNNRAFRDLLGRY